MKHFSVSWKNSKKARKQRKYRANLPIHMRAKLVRAHLSKELRQKHGKRNVSVRVADKVRIVRGQFRKREGKIERVDRKNEKLYITGIEMLKRDGTKVLFPVAPSNVIITELSLSDKKRKGKIGVVKK